MRIAFVYGEMETLGIQYISSILKNNEHSTKLFFDPQLFSDTVTKSSILGNIFDYSEKLIQDIKRYKPDLIAFSVLTTNYKWACALSNKIKRRMSVPVVFGGIHPTSLPYEVIKKDFVDFVIVGEGEYALLELVESGFRKELLPSIRNLYFKNNGKVLCNILRDPIQDLDKLPFPDKDLFYDNLPYLQRSYTIITGRGCPHNCTYCCNGFLNRLYNGKYLRRRSVENVIAELNWAVDKYKVQCVFFDDSTFTYDRNWLRLFTERYKDTIGLPSFCWLHPSDVDDELVGLLKKMNCRAIEMGVENFNSHVRKKLLRRFYSNSDIEKAIELFNKNRIFCVVDNIKGFSDSPEEEMKDFIRFYNRNRPNKIYIFEHRPFPNTEIVEILSHKNEDSIEGLPPFTITTNATSKRVRQLELLLVLIYFMPRNLIKFLLNKQIYRFFPPVPAYNILEILPYFINLFKIKKYRFWYPRRGTRRRYLHYFFSNPVYFVKGLLKPWGSK